MIQKIFSLQAYQTSITKELIAALTTFVTMVYIIFVNPMILKSSGMDIGAVFVATCLIAVIGSLIMGFAANYPLAIAPGMGMNVYFVYIVTAHPGFSWQSALGAVLIAGIVFFILSVSKLRQRIIDDIPRALAVGIYIGLGLLIFLIAFENMHLLDYKSAFVFTLGHIVWIPFLLFLAGIFLLAILHKAKMIGAILITMMVLTLAAFFLGLTKYHGFIALPPSIKPTFDAFNFHDVISFFGVGIVCSYLLALLFDSSGTVLGVLNETKILEDPKRKKKFKAALCADSIATVCGGVLGSSPATPFLESATGVSAGGRTGLTAVFVGILFLLALFISPIVKMVPDFAVAPALVFIGYLMIKNIKNVNWRDATEFIPTVLVALIIPLTASIANGIGVGLIAYALLKLISKKTFALNVIVIMFALLFMIYFAGMLF